ncbi:hypothetical protein BBBOND_0309850 [Babesia bigemina]|uniref:Uncharacterized protein n=1 Tax=Babesia bigemina TaxID=5866 RepID=A0A061DAR4_BABBI|nr:hypothetical protein BBBOND_0309850 [Babesia bigemina]CDR97082.1 hypothetical protein BBBOND_0309850 [Babesia bigemina]|eukprot:XP_012769268.1 hypothetical protein BBBOND_0309850 [Babesia bigemina]
MAILALKSGRTFQDLLIGPAKAAASLLDARNTIDTPGSELVVALPLATTAIRCNHAAPGMLRHVDTVYLLEVTSKAVVVHLSTTARRRDPSGPIR